MRHAPGSPRCAAPVSIPGELEVTQPARRAIARPIAVAASALLSILAGGAVAQAGPVSGVIQTTARQGVVPAAAVVYAEPIDAPVLKQPGTFTLRQKNKTFLPRVLGIPAGSSVRFPNDDGIFHNVFSLSAPQPFDLGLYRSGESPSRTFALPGMYRVFCNIHPLMSALILVVPTAHVAQAGPDGRFVLDLPPGRFRLTAVSERASPASVEVVSETGATVAPPIALDESGVVLAQHKNKFGKDYPRAAYKQ
jgi:plastocyanin